jgi:streptogramin lyase
MRAQLQRKASLLIGAALLVTPGQAMAAEPVAETTIDEIVMYAVESSSPARLMRYFFLSDTFIPIAEVWTTEGYPVEDLEALSYVPQGPYKGLYGVATDGPTEQYLTRIDPLTAVAFKYQSNIGGEHITGMIGDYDPVTDEWYLLGSDQGGKLRRIDPATGNALTLCNVGHDFEGLARDSEGILFAITRTELFRLDLIGVDQYDAVKIGNTGLDKAESLEFAFGNNAPPVEMPGVGVGWTDYGVLFVFDDDTNNFGILNPTSGQFKEYLVDGSPCAFSNEDAEGMIFVTTINDPLYGSIDGFD